jgi:glycerophosphoryl diester phosphodiesterase
MDRPPPGPAAWLGRGLALLGARGAEILVYGLAFQLLSVAVLSPAIALVARGLFALTGRRAVANADLLAFAVSPLGALGLLVLLTLSATLSFAGQAGVFAIAAAAAEGRRLGWLDALGLLRREAVALARLALAVVLRALSIVLPFVALAGLAFGIGLGEHDINYYLAEGPPEFWTTAAVVALLLLAMLAVLADRLVGWLLAIPLAVLGGEPTATALRRGREIASARGPGRALLALAAGPLAVLAAAALLGAAGTLAGDALLDAAGGRLRTTALCLGLLAIASTLAGLATGIAAAAAAVCTATALLEAEGALGALAPTAAAAGPAPVGRRRWIFAGTLAAAGFAAAIGAELVGGIRSPDRVVAIAHRAGAAHGPENSRAALRAAIAAGADLAEIDVQRAADGTVVVVHDRDLMKLAGLPLRVAATSSGQLARADVGNGEGIGTLAEFCALAGDRIRLCVELKYYGWDEELAPATLAVLRAAGCLDRAELMSLDARAVAQVRRLAPGVRLGYLSSVALGDPGRLDVDFLALADAAATTRRIASARARGLQVYAWTLNTADAISDAIDRGVDGVITDDPPLLSRVLAERAGLGELERLLLRFGAVHGR